MRPGPHRGTVRATVTRVRANPRTLRSIAPVPEDDSRGSSLRAVRYAIAIIVVVIGALCGALIPGTLGGTICIAVVGIGLIAVVSLVFYDVGLSEDRERAREDLRRARVGRGVERPDVGEQPSARDASPHPLADAASPSLGRLRGQRRRLR